MSDNKRKITGKCVMFACRICRTKVGWPHQSWCELSHIIEPDCADCRYFLGGECRHPLKRNGGVLT